MAYHLHDGTPAPKPFKIDTEPPSRASPAPLSAPLLTPTSRLYMLGKSQTGLSDLDLLRSSLSASSEGMALALSPVRSNSLSVLFGDPEPSQMVESASAAPAAPAYMLSDRTSSEVSIVHNPPFLSGLSQPELIPGALGAWMNDSDSVSQAETAVTDPIELPPLPTEYSTGEGQPQAEATGLPLLLQHVVSNPETGAQTVELVLYDPVSGNCVVVPPELAAGVKFVQDEALTQSLNLEFPLDGSTNVKVEQGPMLPPIAAPPSLVAPVPMSLPATRRPASPQRPQKQRSKRSRTGMPIPSMDNGGQLYPQSALYEEPASEAGDQLGTTPSFEAFRAAFRNHRSHRGSESLDSTPRTSRTSSMAYDDSGASLPPSRTGSPLGKRAFTATEDREIGSGIQELVIDGTEQVKKPKKLYYCGYEGCERSFTTSGHLSRHKRIHIGNKTFVCPLPHCTSSFFRSDNMMTHYRVHARKLGVKPLDDAHAVASGEYDADMSAAGLDGPAQKRAYESAMGVTKMAEAGQLRVTNNDAMNVLKTGSTGSLIGDVALMAGNVEPAVGRGKKERKGARA